jgi:hypothetical protein
VLQQCSCVWGESIRGFRSNSSPPSPLSFPQDAQRRYTLEREREREGVEREKGHSLFSTVGIIP